LREDATEDEEKIRNEKLKIYAKKTDALEQNLIVMHTIIWGKASPTMRPRSSQSRTMRPKLMHMTVCGCYNRSRQNHNELQKQKETHDVQTGSKRAV